MSKGHVLSLCDYTGTFVAPWVEDGYDATCVDIQHGDGRDFIHDTSGAYATFLGGDLTDDDTLAEMKHLASESVFVSSFPPCTDLAVSGARWFKSKGLTALVEALDLVDRCRQIAEASDAPWFLENPVSVISTHWRKPDHIFHPWEYGGYEGGEGDGYTKKTCLWTGGGFVMPEPKPIDLDPDSHDRIHKAAPSPERANFRSATPAGFSRAVFEVNA